VTIFTWVGKASTSWVDPANWTDAAGSGTAPAEGDDVVIAFAPSEPGPDVNLMPSLNSLSVQSGASLILGDFTFIANTVTNDGTITGTNRTGDATGVLIEPAKGAVTNSGTITGDGDGVTMQRGGLITNSATGIIRGGSEGARINTFAGTITNAGTITGASLDGVSLQLGGLVTNGLSGVIEGGIDGLRSIGGTGTVTNDGTISGTTGTGVLFSDSPGVFNNALTNSGTIIGTTAAVRFGAGDDLLTLLPGASFTGLVDGGAGTNTLELAGTVAGSLTGLGTGFVNFETLLVDVGAQWTVAGNGDLGGIAISGLTALDTIDLTDLAFGQISWTFANNTLVLTSATAQDTLHIQGDLSAGDFHVSSDGARGTDIVVVPSVAPITPVAAPSTSPLTVFDITTGKPIAATGENYTGPVAGLQHEFIIDASPDNLAVTASTPNWFIHTGSGDDAIAVSSGTNVLDGGTGSNFLTGGSGTDVFFVDDRLPGANIWSTVVGFHSGDDATIFGVTASDFHLAWLDNQGAASAQGLTGGFTANGQPTANITLAGYSTADLGTKLSVTFGKTADITGLPGSVYMNIHGN
jgi:hypothetical protein